MGEGAGDINNWQVAVAPQNSTSPEGIKNVIVEDNRFVYNPAAPLAQTQVVLTGISLYERGNSFTAAIKPIKSGTGGQGEALPPEWQGPYFTGRPSVTSWILSKIVSPPAPVTLQVE